MEKKDEFEFLKLEINEKKKLILKKKIENNILSSRLKKCEKSLKQEEDNIENFKNENEFLKNQVELMQKKISNKKRSIEIEKKKFQIKIENLKNNYNNLGKKQLEITLREQIEERKSLELFHNKILKTLKDFKEKINCLKIVFEENKKDQNYKKGKIDENCKSFIAIMKY